jgi:hypothetical protein
VKRISTPPPVRSQITSNLPYALLPSNHKKKLSKERCPGGHRNSGLLGISLEEAKATSPIPAPHSTKPFFQREIRKAKKEHWIRFRQIMNNDHQAALKEITKKDATVHLPTSAIINGIIVNDQMEILKHCSSLFFPADPPTSPPQFSCLERSHKFISQPLLSSPEPITSNELALATSSLKI